MSGRAAKAAIYPQQLIDAIIDGFEIEDARKVFTIEDVMNKVHIDELHESQDSGWRYIDDNTGETLNKEKVRQARGEELKTFEEMGVYVYVKREVARADKSGKIVGVRWVDILKDSGVRSRLVAQEFAHQGDRDDIFAGTPPLAATKFLISDMASRGARGPGGCRMMILDVKRAFLYGDIEDKIYIELPEEDTMKSKGYVGLLKKAMYGTRAAPQVWQEVVRKKMVSLDFVPSIKFPCVYFHKVKNLKVVTHVDDFLATGKKSDLGWLKENLQEDFELKGTILGPGADEAKEEKYLGRTIRWKEHGIEYEGDGKHAQILLQEWQLQDSKAVGSPGVPEEKKLDMNNEEQTLVNGTRAKAFRRGAARINYMSLDRMDLSFASNSTSKGMANPTEADEVRLKRTIRYIKGRPAAKILYKWQERPTEAVAYTDSDWAGCQKTRRSTSGGIIMLGCHAIQHWTSTQHNVANSSGEAELNALNKAVS